MEPNKNRMSFLPSSSIQPPESSAGGLSLVHTQESKLHNGIDPSYRGFLLSGLGDRPEQIYRVFKFIDDRDSCNRMRSLLSCRQSAWFVQHRETHEIRVASSRCHQRWCPLCERTDRFATTQAVKAKLVTMKKPRFITLTLKHTSNRLSDQIDHLYASFRKIRRMKNFVSHVSGGVWFFQLKKIGSNNEWHPHIHILCQGKYYPQDMLSRDWNKASSGSFIVDVRAVKDIDKSAEYVARYATAPADLGSLSLDDGVDVYDSLYGRKIKGTWGDMRDVKLTAQPPDDSADWQYVAGYADVMMNRSSNIAYDDLYYCWVNGQPCHIEPPDPPPIEAQEATLPDEIVTFRQLYLFRD